MVRVMPENESVVRLEYTSHYTGTPNALLIASPLTVFTTFVYFLLAVSYVNRITRKVL